MKSLYQPPVEKNLIKVLRRHESIKSIVKITGLSLEDIFKNCALEIPEEYHPGVGWLIIWDPNIFNIKDEHQDLIQIILKFAWSYAGISLNDRFKSYVDRELTMFEAGMKLQALRQQKRNAGQKSREWKDLNHWILKKLKLLRKWTVQDLWNALPESYGEEKFFCDGDKIHCKKESRKPISFRGFSDHVREMRKKIKYG